MLYDLEWLKQGENFPPTGEVQRLSTYRDNRLLFDGEIDQVMQGYHSRLRNILANLNTEFNILALDSAVIELNYFEALTVKTGDLVAGIPPTITLKSEQDINKQTEILEHTDFENKLLETVYDLTRYGESISRLYVDKEDTSKVNYVILSPEMWFPIVDKENNKKVEKHCICWVEKTGNKKYVLRVQVHIKGSYSDYTYGLKDYDDNCSYDENNQTVKYSSAKIDVLLDEQNDIKTGFDDFAIIHFTNTRTSDSIHGRNDYDRVQSLLAELQIRYALQSLILDKHSAPTMYGSQNALKQTRGGTWGVKVGGYIAMQQGDPTPGYLTWDASFAANQKQIDNLEKHLAALSEMGSILNNDAVNSSQGFEALEIKMTNARLKARRIASKLVTPLKKLLSMVSSNSGLPVKPNEISIEWNDGIPNNEFRNTEIAERKKRSGLFDIVTILIEHFEKTPEQAEEIVQRMQDELGSNAFMLKHTNSNSDDDLDEENLAPDGDTG